MQSKSRVYSGMWLAVGLIMATMYAVNGIQASSIPYFFVAFGWALLAAIQWWRWRPEAAASGESESAARRRLQLSRYLTVVAFLVIIGGLAARWWA